MQAGFVIQRVLNERAWSRDRIAAEFVGRFRFTAPDKKRSARSFAAEIRKLEAGDITWFSKRPAAAALIAEILEATPGELGIGPSDDLLTFVDFPEVRPLDLATEDPYGIDAWRPLLEEAKARPIWLSTGSGSGKTTFSQWAARRGYATRIGARTLSSVEREVAARHGVVIVDVHAVEAEDIGAQRRLESPNLIVVAPEERPHTPNEQSSWIDYRWPSDAFDPRGFVDWIASRLPDGTAIADRLWRKLCEFDPDGTLIATPDDAVQFLGAIFEKRAASNADAVIRRAAVTTGSEWLASHARSVFRDLAVARWRDLRHRYRHPAPREAWDGYVPSDLVAPKDRATLRAALKTFKEGRSGDADAVADRLLHDQRSIVGLMEDAKLLVRDSDGLLTLRPRWLAHADVVGHLRATLTSDPKLACMVAVDSTRRSVIDDVLVRMGDQEFEGFVKTAARLTSDEDLGTIATVETAFAVTARRFERGHGIKNTKLLSTLATRQLELLITRHDGAPPAPTTRPGPNFVGGNSFVADCWTWSMMIAKPDQDVDSWMFPGWLSEAPCETVPWLHGLDTVGSGDAGERLRLTFATMLKKWSPTAWKRIPAWMWPALLVTDPEWPIDVEEARVLREDRVAQRLADSLKHLAAERTALALRRLWSVASSWSLGDLLGLLRGPIREKLFEAFDLQLVASAIPGWARDAPYDLGQIPPMLRGPLVRWRLGNDLAGEMWSQVTHLGSSDHEILVQLANGPSGWFAIEHLWNVAPLVARHELETRLAANDADAARWLEGSVSVTETILELIEHGPKPYSPAIRRWGARRLLDAPWLAERLLSLRNQ
jgi:hypothetical protein